MLIKLKVQMRNHSKLVLAVIASCVMLAAAVSTASANRIALSNSNVRVAFRQLIFAGEAGEQEVRCDVTIEGSFHSRTITKVVGALIGYITRGTVNESSCAGIARARINQESLPWHIRYRGFTGTLPLFSTVLLEMTRPKFTLIDKTFGLTCIYEGTMFGSVTREGVLRADEAKFIPRTGGSGGEFLCPNPGSLTGSAQAALLGTTVPITLRLI